jgi:hypothetical protein
MLIEYLQCFPDKKSANHPALSNCRMMDGLDHVDSDPVLFSIKV